MKLKIFEAFSGIGAQHKALSNLKNNNKIDFEIVGTSEWFINAMIAYTLIHHKKEYETFKKHLYMSHSELLEKLKSFTFSTDSKNPLLNLETLKYDKLKELYIAIKLNQNYGSIVDIKANKLPKIDILTYSFPCFVAGTLVLTNKGYKEIETLKEGEKVLTHTNSYQKIVKTMINETNTIYEINSMASENIKTTSEHPFYVRQKIDINTKIRKDNFDIPKWIEVKDLNPKTDYLGIAINQKSKIPKIKENRKNSKYNLKNVIDNKDFWWLVGLYIGDGWININKKNKNHRIVICASSKNLQHLKIEKKLNNLNIHFSKVLEKSIYKYHICWKELTLFLLQFNRGAINKELNDTILNLPITYMKKFIQGYLFADGSYLKKSKTYTFTTVSQKLAYGIGQCIAKAYKQPFAIYKVEKKNTYIIENRIVNQKDNYIIRFSLDKNKIKKSFYDNDYIWFPIKSITKYEENTKVYNIEVENDNSYTVNNVICHNCQDLSIAGKKAGMEKGSNTRSGLLWEVKRILEEAKELNNLPKSLLLENVSEIYSNKHKPHLIDYLEEIKELGYSSHCFTLNVKDYGIPQTRKRAFIVSFLEKDNKNPEIKFYDKKEIEELFPLKKTPLIKDFLGWDNNNSNILYYQEELKAMPNDTPSRRAMLEGKFKIVDQEKKMIFKPSLFLDDKASYANCITTKQDRIPNSGIVLVDEFFRFLTPRETFLLMGFENDDFDKISYKFGTNELYKFAGNSIGVNVLEMIFEYINNKLQA